MWCEAANQVWSTHHLEPLAAITAAWPDLVALDMGIKDLWLGAVALTGATAEGCFDFLRIRWDEAADHRAVQRELMALYAQRFPSILQLQGEEVSFYPQHLNQYGGLVGHVPYPAGSSVLGTLTKKQTVYGVAAVQAAFIRSRGGLVSLNHPFGGSIGGPLPDQEVLRRKVAAAMVKAGEIGVDLLEVGYADRGSANLRTHIEFWDVMLRNGFHQVGVGASDDHVGEVGTWTSTAQPLQHGDVGTGASGEAAAEAMRLGRVYMSELGSFDGTLDLLVDDVVPMGGVSVGEASERSLAVFGRGLPPGSVVNVVQGRIDYVGSGTPDPLVTTIATISAAALAGGSTLVPIDTTASTYVRTEVVTSAGRGVAMSNPVFLYREPPRRAVPVGRLH